MEGETGMQIEVGDEGEEQMDLRLGADMARLGMTQSDLNQRCNELFGFTQPIPFKSSGNQLDVIINNLVEVHEIKIPIINIKDNKYLIGVNKKSCELKGNKVLIRVGGGYESLQDYVLKNQKHFERSLIINMVKSEESLEYVCNQLIKGESIIVSEERRSKTNSKSSSNRGSFLSSPVHKDGKSFGMS
jgi:hypothetical protein